MNASTRLISNKYKGRISSLPFRLYRVHRRAASPRVVRGLDITPVVHASYRDYPRYSNKFSLLPQSPSSSSRPPVARLLSIFLSTLLRGTTRIREVRSADLRGTSANSADARAAICKDLLFEFILSFLLGMTFRNET